MQEVDELAFNVAQEVNAVHRAGFGLDAVGGRDLFVPIVAVAGAALDMRVEAGVMADPDQLAAATDPLSVPGDNRNLIALTGLQVTRQAALGNVSFNSYFSEIVRGIGSAVSQNDQNSDLHEARFAQSEALRASVEGVSIDDEMVDLTRFQKHFEASARVMDTVNRLMDEIMSLVR